MTGQDPRITSTHTRNGENFMAGDVYFTAALYEGDAASFRAVDGLDSEPQPMENQPAASTIYSPIEMPGLGGVGNVTLRNGIFVNDTAFSNWCSQVAMNTVAPRTVTISQVDEDGTPRTTWTLNNAWPTKITGTALASGDSEAAVESVEVAYQTPLVAAS